MDYNANVCYHVGIGELTSLNLNSRLRRCLKLCRLNQETR